MKLLRALLSTTICSILMTIAAADESKSIEARQRKQDLSFCFSEDSICSQSSKLYDQCSDLQDNFKDLNPWYECVCGNGYTSTDQACNWCQAAYNLTYTVGIVEDQIETCQSLSYSIAPIPTQIVAIQSSFNATYTGILQAPNGGSSPSTSGADSSPTSSRSAGTVTSGSATATAPSTSRSAKSASTFVSTVTLNGGANGAGATRSSTTGDAQQQSPTATPSATPTGAAQGGRDGFAVGFSVLMSAILGLVMV
ncbi:hypothetical protein BKA65DRAFT_511734 [Rhexocercosporidium sp. MPI-PUGE-AT-0058]|nr:hypothetical protein BKA65DRAFT_511734 [Rhexocercosporidium sp. MPI-PUGE-AT-0058]